ncbi:MAG: 5-bromo-4-chloroindolyl phosphate hydrolysis family protein [Pseudomonadota bacterium]
MSARRFGGQFSPKGHAVKGGASAPSSVLPPERFAGRKASQVDVRGLLLFILPAPLLLAAIGNIGGGAIFGALMDLVAFAALMLGAWLVREGQSAQLAYDARAVARPPAFPRKTVAAGLAAAGVGIAVFFGWGQDLITAIGFAALTAAAHLASFGTDPMKSKGIDLHTAEAERVADALDKAEAKIAEIESATRTLGDREITGRVATLLASIRDLLAMIEKDPRDLTRARRYLSVNLTGAHEATRKYAENHERLSDPKLRDDYLALLGELEASFDRGREKLLQDDRTDLEVEIEVLRERLGQETG